jgi:hypothetical protein
MVLKGGEVDPRLSLSQPQTMKSLSQLFDLRGMAAKSILVARGRPLGLSRERAAQPDLAWEATPERRIKTAAGKLLALSASSASLHWLPLALRSLPLPSSQLYDTLPLQIAVANRDCAGNLNCKKLPRLVHSAKATSAT